MDPVSRAWPVLAFLGLSGLAGCSLLAGLPLPFGDKGVAADRAESKGIEGPIAGAFVSGRVVDEDGKPIAKVKVAAFGAATSPIVGNNSAGLGQGGQFSDVGTPLFLRLPSGFGWGRGVFAGTPEAVTDDSGAFQLGPLATGSYNLEAVKSAEFKAWRDGVSLGRPGAAVAVGTLHLAPTGAVEGRVRSAIPGVTDLSNAFVFIPGSSYLAITGLDGRYKISSVPEGAFDLGAYHADLGEARLKGGQDARVRVAGRQTTQAPDLTLEAVPPALTHISLAGSEEILNHAAPGMVVDLHGRHFGLKKGTRFQVNFTGGLVEAPERVSDEIIRVRVPANAGGEVNVVVGGLPSGKVSFRVIAGLRACFDSFSVNAGTRYDLSSLVEATDAAGGPIGTPGGPRVGSSLAWRVEAGDAAVDPGGMLDPRSAGTASILALAGTLPAATFAVTVKLPEVPVTAPAMGCESPRLPVRTRIAGSGIEGNLDGVGVFADLSYPSGIAVDGAGAVFVAESLNHRIRRMVKAEESAGQEIYAVETWAGRTAKNRVDGPRRSSDGQTAASLGMPHGLAFDPRSGDLVVADREFQRVMTPVSTLIRRFSQETDYLLTLTPEQRDPDALPPGAVKLGATILEFFGVAVGQNGDIYVGNTGYNGVCVLREGGSTLEVLAGSGDPGWADGSAVQARFSYPSGVAVDPSGRVWVSDSGNHAVRRVSPDGTVVTVAGKPGVSGFRDGKGETARFSRPMGMTADPQGNVYLVDLGNHALRKVAPDGTVTTIMSDLGEDGLPAGYAIAVARDAYGSFFVTSSQHVVWKIRP